MLDTLLSMIASVVLYDLRGGEWVILPLAWATERLCNGFWHVWWSVHFREYSPGMLSSILIWMDSYFIVRYHPVGGTHRAADSVARGAHRIDSCDFSGFLYSSGKRQRDAQESWSISTAR